MTPEQDHFRAVLWTWAKRVFVVQFVLFDAYALWRGDPLFSLNFWWLVWGLPSLPELLRMPTPPDTHESARRALAAWHRELETLSAVDGSSWAAVERLVVLERPRLEVRGPRPPPTPLPPDLPNDVIRSGDGLVLERAPTDDELAAMLLAITSARDDERGLPDEARLLRAGEFPTTVRRAAIHRLAQRSGTDPAALALWKESFRGTTRGLALAAATRGHAQLVAAEVRQILNDVDRRRSATAEDLVAALSSIAGPQDEQHLLLWLEELWDRRAALDLLARIGGAETLRRLPEQASSWTFGERRLAERTLLAIRARTREQGALTLPRDVGELTLAQESGALVEPAPRLEP